MEITQLLNISGDTGEASTDPMCELVNKYVDVSQIQVNCYMRHQEQNRVVRP